MNAPTLSAATAAVSTMEAVVDAALGRLAMVDIDEHQVVAYDIAHGAAAVASARNLLGYGAHGEAEERLTVAFVADVAHDLATRLLGREADWGVERSALDGIHDFMATGRAPELLASLVGGAPSHLDEDMQLASDTFRRFADEQIAPRAEHVHRTNANVPEELIEGLAELGILLLLGDSGREGRDHTLTVEVVLPQTQATQVHHTPHDLARTGIDHGVAV